MKDKVRVAYIFERYPVLSQTFLRREIRALVAQGIEVEIYSMLPGEMGDVPAIAEVRMNYFRWWEAALFPRALLREWRREPSLLRQAWNVLQKWRPVSWENFWAAVWALIFAVSRAKEFRKNPPDVFHGVRATGPATAAALLGRLCGKSFSFGAHAYDIYRHGGDAFLPQKIEGAVFVHTSTEMAREYLIRQVPDCAHKIILARRGLESLPSVIERKRNAKVRLLSVGRLVAKKGHAQQIEACVLLKRWGVQFEARIVGDGELRESLQQLIDALGLWDQVTLCGAMSEEETAREYAQADIFWHAGVTDSDGDRDGLPNVIPEAMAWGLPVVTTNHPGAMEAVTNEVTGLVTVNTTESLAEAVRRLTADETLRREIYTNGRCWVGENFLNEQNAKILLQEFYRTQVSKPNLAFDEK